MNLRGSTRSRVLARGDKVLVRPSYVTNPHDFYVRRVEDDDWLTTFQELVAADLPLKFGAGSPPGYSTLVLLHHEKFGWVRGQVVDDSKNGKHSVFILDYGETVHGIDTRELRELVIGGARPALAIHCRLYFCEPRSGVWNPDSINVFLDYLGKEAMKMTVMRRTNTGQLEVQLHNNLPETVSMMMVMAEVACFVTGPQQVNRLLPTIPDVPAPRPFSLTYDTLPLNTETEVRLLYIEGNIFYVAKKERYPDYHSLSAVIKAHFSQCEPLQSDRMVTEMPIICKLTRRTLETYFRGIICSVNADEGTNTADVYLVDVGARQTVSIADGSLRRPTPHMLKEPTFAIRCRLTEEQEIDNELCVSLFPGNHFTIVPKKSRESNKSLYIISVVKDYTQNI